MPPYVRHRTRSILLNGRELSLQCSIFALMKSEHCQLTVRPIELMGLIATSLFGTRGFPCLQPGSPPTTRISFVYYVYFILLAGSKSVVKMLFMRGVPLMATSNLPNLNFFHAESNFFCYECILFCGQELQIFV